VNRPHDRDQAIDRLLRQSLKTPPTSATDACLDAETVAAWADGGLSGEALEVAQLHVADCARCQVMVAGVVRAAAKAPLPDPSPRRWLAWLVPLTAAAAAVAIWVAVPRGPGVVPQSVAENQNQAAQAKVEPAAPTPRSEPSTLSKEAQATTAKRDQAPSDQPQAAELRKDADRHEVDRLSRDSQAGADSAALADKAPPAAAQASAPAPPPAAPAPSAAPVAREVFQTRAATNAASEKLAAANVAISPDPAIRWRISATGLEHSTDGGATWDSVATGVSSALTAISAPSTTVCWVVGRSAVVLRTTDGRNFSRLPFPEMADLSVVQATDARSATVTASDGRVFTTSDGGATWQRL
jgi:photosynthesis system II assembly factor YCF48-like protein